MTRLGPGKFTLAAVAKEAGLSAAALVKRFGSKRGLLLASSRSAVDRVNDCFDAIRTLQPSALEALLMAATEMARHTKSPAEMANHLAFLQIDVSDPDFRKSMLEISRGMLRGYKTLLDDAVKARELVPCDTESLARAIASIAGGSLLNWAVFQKGPAERWVRADLDTVLTPYKRPRRK
jgi:AcrR family transcriptional regulator